MIFQLKQFEVSIKQTKLSNLQLAFREQSYFRAQFEIENTLQLLTRVSTALGYPVTSNSKQRLDTILQPKPFKVILWCVLIYIFHNYFDKLA